MQELSNSLLKTSDTRRILESQRHRTDRPHIIDDLISIGCIHKQSGVHYTLIKSSDIRLGKA